MYIDIYFPPFFSGFCLAFLSSQEVHIFLKNIAYIDHRARVISNHGKSVFPLSPSLLYLFVSSFPPNPLMPFRSLSLIYSLSFSLFPLFLVRLSLSRALPTSHFFFIKETFLQYIRIKKVNPRGERKREKVKQKIKIKKEFFSPFTVKTKTERELIFFCKVLFSPCLR